MKGLRKQESSEFMNYMELVQTEANKRNKTFFLDCGDGNEGFVSGVYVCDLFGWLISEEQEESFVTSWKNDDVSDEWIDCFVSVTWKDENGLVIEFD